MTVVTVSVGRFEHRRHIRILLVTCDDETKQVSLNGPSHRRRSDDGFVCNLSMSSSIVSSDIEIAVQAGTSFVQLYYAAYDADSRAEDVPKFYRSHSAISWNGNPIQGPEGLADLLKKMPATGHNVQSFDCHPVPNTQGPSLLVTVSGMVQHGPPPPTWTNAMGEKKDKPGIPTGLFGGGATGTSNLHNYTRTVDGQPRVFSQTFVLMRDPDTAGAEPGKLGKYIIKADTLRFVG